MTRHDTRRQALLRIGGTLALGSLGLPSAANEGFPNKRITMIVPYGAGSGTDIMTRLIVPAMEKDLGQTIVVENRAGAGGTIGSAAVARSAPDGYTLAMGTISSHSINESMMKDVPYRVLRDFTPISQVAHFPSVLAANKSLPANNIQELIELTKARGSLSFATGGVASSAQMGGELLKTRTGMKLEHIPYKEAGQAISDCIAGHVPLIVYQVPALLQHIQSGQLKALATLGAKRSPLLPNVPTPAEQGLKDFDATAWAGLFGPANMPAAVTQRLHRALTTALADPAVRTELERRDFTPVGSEPAAFRKFLAADIDKWAEVVKVTGAAIK
jgi:tripartite-type tricarboxylate transporter receptor subunit TctC